jgi:DNA-binding winged helix-turn-helix (wHTH) protein
VLRCSEGGERRARRKQQRACYRFAGWELDLRTRRLTAPNGEAPTLTAGEFNLLTGFPRSPQQVLSREQLLAASRVHDEEVFDRSVDIQILRLRRELEADPSEPRLIRTERGAGYVLSVPVKRDWQVPRSSARDDSPDRRRVRAELGFHRNGQRPHLVAGCRDCRHQGSWGLSWWISVASRPRWGRAAMQAKCSATPVAA